MEIKLINLVDNWTIKLAKRYEMSPAIRGLVQLIPIFAAAIHEYLIAVLEKESKFEKIYHTKEEFNKKVIYELESQPNFLRAIIVGPHFLHPDFIIKRRMKKENRRSFSCALRTYLEKSLKIADKDIRIIIRNNDRYLDYLKSLIEPHEIEFIIKEMEKNCDNIFKDKSINICCKDVGFFYGVIITNNSYFKYGRSSEFTQIESFYQSNDEEKIRIESAHFDKTFNANYKGRDNEIGNLNSYIKSLGKKINLIPTGYIIKHSTLSNE